jgi:hypothetical protein
MGVPGLTEYLRTHHFDCFVDAPSSSDHVYIDMNALL